MGDAVKIDVSNVDFYYGNQKALHDVSMKVREHFVTALIGPSGCGKSTFLRSLNRMNDLIPGARLEGRVNLDGEDIYSSSMDVIHLRRRVGMIFQRSNPFPMSIYENVAYGVRVNGLTRDRLKLDEIVERTLRSAALWDEVKDRLSKSAMGLSGGQQQRLCIARALAVQPEVLLMDEPFGALDPRIRLRMQELLLDLWKEQAGTIFLVTHSVEEAVYLGDRVFVMASKPGRLVEVLKVPRPTESPEESRRKPWFMNFTQALLRRLEEESTTPALMKV